MSYVVWDEEMKLGVDLFDHHHKRWVAALNEVFKAINEAAPSQIIGDSIEKFRRYSYFHLRVEEEKMAEYEYPGLEAHKVEHDKYRGKIKELKKAHEAGEQINSELMKFLKEWLLNHIEVTDQKYVPHLGPKLAEEEADELEWEL